MGFTQDYILRMIEQLNRAIATILRHRREERYEEALEAVSDACDELLGHQAAFLDTLDVASVVRTLGKWPRIKVLAALWASRADVLEDRGLPEDVRRAGRARRRALGLLLRGRALGGRGDPDLIDRVRELVPRVDLSRLAAAERSQLEGLD